MSNSNKLSIYLIKDEFTADDDLILEKHELLADIPNIGIVYYKRSHYNVPKWVNSFFGDTVDTTNIFTANARAVLIIRINVVEGNSSKEKVFAVSMGHGKHLLKENVVEDDFGLRVVLNTIKPNSLRRINKISIGGNQKTSNEQLPLKSQIDDFGFDIDRDLIGAVTGDSDDEGYVKGILTGSDLLSLTAEVDVTNILEFLKSTYRKYNLATYKNSFSWIDHIKRVKDTRVIDALDAELMKHILEDSPAVWMAVPEVINWEDIAGFKYYGRELYNDIDISIIRNSFRKGFETITQLKTGKRVTAISALDGISPYASWSAYRCIFGELEHNDRSYCINNGRWFTVDKDFVNQVNIDYSNTPISTIDFIDYTDNHKSENDYSVEFANTDASTYLCMDNQNISYGGGHSKIELCDILTCDKTYIHVKPYSGSSTLSHLFNQAVVSAELVLGDLEFCAKANTEINKNTTNAQFNISRDDKISVVFAIISKSEESKPSIPFFSRVALRYIKRRLEVFGCSVSIKNINKTKSISVIS